MIELKGTTEKVEKIRRNEKNIIGASSWFDIQARISKLRWKEEEEEEEKT